MSGEKFPIQVLQSWGIASARHTSGSTVPSRTKDTEFLFDAPLGPSIVRWDVSTQQRLRQFQAHQDLVTCMRRSPSGEYIATTCYSGGVKLWSSEWECLAEVTAPMVSQHHLAWSCNSRRFLIVGNGVNSSIVMYGVQPDCKTRLKQVWQVKARQSPAEDKGQSSEVEGQIPAAATSGCHGNNPSNQTTGKDYNYGNAFYMAEITPAGNVIAVEERQHGSTSVQLFSPDGEAVKETELQVEGSEKKIHTLFISTYRNGCYAIGVQGGYVVLVEAETLRIINKFKVGFSSRTCAWDGDSLILPSDSGKLTWWNNKGEKLCEFKAGSADFIVRLDWSVSGHALWMCGFSELSFLELKRNKDGSISEVSTGHVIKSHEITCCGVGFSPSGRYLASGDLAGNVWVTEGVKPETLYKCSVGMSVRCLVWQSDVIILIGCLDGLVHQWGLESGPQSKILFAMEGSVIHMRWNHAHKLLAVGTSKGVLGVYNMSMGEDYICPVAVFTAHPPRDGQQDMRFGQLTKQAEIWSLCWSPDDCKVATCSEDQTTRIWETKTWKCVTTLTGHTMAVTSVDWKYIEVEKRNLIATCADDRTVRVVDGETFELLRTVNTTDILGWHTLTYLAFNPAEGSSVLVCTTQNGHVVVWDIASGQRLTSGKVHCGSIEGLAWDPTHNCFATVGADCTVLMMRLNAKSH